MRVLNKLLPEDEAIRILREYDLDYIIERAYENENGCIWFDLSSGALVDNQSLTTVKLYCIENPLDNLPVPVPGADHLFGYEKTIGEENYEAIEEEKEKLSEMNKEELEEIGLEEIKMGICIRKQEVMTKLESIIQDYYALHKLFKK